MNSSIIFDLPAGTVQLLLSRLEKLALIDLLPRRNFGVKVVCSVLWRKTPLRQRFGTEVKPQFFAMNFANLGQCTPRNKPSCPMRSQLSGGNDRAPTP